VKPYPESRETLQAQVDALEAGTNWVVYFPFDTEWMPTLPDNAQVIFVHEDVPGRGTYFFDPFRTTEEVIRNHAQAGTHGLILGFVQSKEEVAKGIPGVLVARDERGVELKSACVDVSNLEAVYQQNVILKLQFPKSSVKMETLTDVLLYRLDHKAVGAPAN
jgi:hypothetical protein